MFHKIFSFLKNTIAIVIVTRGGVWGERELDEDSQIIQTSSYK